MTKIQNSKIFEVRRERTFQFAKNVGLYVKKSPQNSVVHLVIGIWNLFVICDLKL